MRAPATAQTATEEKTVGAVWQTNSTGRSVREMAWRIYDTDAMGVVAEWIVLVICTLNYHASPCWGVVLGAAGGYRQGVKGPLVGKSDP